MKGFILAIFISCLAVSMVFAEEATTVKKEVNLRTEGTEVAEGKVRSVTPSGIAKPNADLIIIDDKGSEIRFTVSSAAVVYSGSDGRLMSLDEILVGQRVLANYVKTKDGTYKATGVKVFPKEEEQPVREEGTPAKETVK